MNLVNRADDLLQRCFSDTTLTAATIFLFVYAAAISFAYAAGWLSEPPRPPTPGCFFNIQ